MATYLALVCLPLFKIAVCGAGLGSENACGIEGTAGSKVTKGAGFCAAPAASSTTRNMLQHNFEALAAARDKASTAAREAKTMIDIERSHLLWETDEHQRTGDSVIAGEFKGSDMLEMDSGHSASYGDILALCGDYYGFVDEPISDVCDEADQEERFRKTFGCLERSGTLMKMAQRGG